MFGGCLAASCLMRLAIAALIIIGILWLFGVLLDELLLSLQA